VSRIIHVYCDESRQTKERFMVLGGLAISAKKLPEFNASIAQCRAEERMPVEFKWTQTRGKRLMAYKRFLDCFFALNNTDFAHFHALIIDTHQIDKSRFPGSDDDTFYKWFYFLLLHCFGKKYCAEKPDNVLLVYLDYRNSSYPLSKLKSILNAGMLKKFQKDHAPFHSVEPIDSKTCESIQIVDVLIGAIGYVKNGYDVLAQANPAKKALAQYIKEKTGLTSITQSTQKNIRRFTIWNFQLQKNSALKT
jgi:uncharacterized protein DUF3800